MMASWRILADEFRKRARVKDEKSAIVRNDSARRIDLTPHTPEANVQ